MNFQCSDVNNVMKEADKVVFFIPEQSDVLSVADYKELSESIQLLKDVCTSYFELEKFRGKSSQLLIVQTQGKLHPRELVFQGVGEIQKLTMKSIQEKTAALARKIQGSETNHIACFVPQKVASVLGSANTLHGMTVGMILGTYVFDVHKRKSEVDSRNVIDTVTYVCEGVPAQQTSAVKQAKLLAEAVCYARNLINEPPSLTTPAYLAAEAQKLATKDGKITVEILGPAEMKALGMGALLAIARGSATEPRFIVLRYHGGGKRTVALVGKGITFDTGGLSLKTADGMETMKLDMSGAAAVLSVFRLLPDLGVTANVVGLISATENMPGPNAVKPGDIAVAMNGKSIEILNTDAEGRVVLADAMSYAEQKVKPEVIIDLATLTGACMIALGTEVAGLFSNDKTLASQLLTAAENSGEKLWELPLVQEYRKLLDSTVADIKNIAGRYGGAITGALFIQDFVPAGTAWAHLDIAGPSFAEKDTPLMPRGGTGYGIALLTEYLVKAEQNQEK